MNHVVSNRTKNVIDNVNREVSVADFFMIRVVGGSVRVQYPSPEFVDGGDACEVNRWKADEASECKK